MKGYLIQWSPPTPRQPDGATIDFRATDKLKLKNAPKKADVEFLVLFYLQNIISKQEFQKQMKISKANFEILSFFVLRFSSFEMKSASAFSDCSSLSICTTLMSSSIVDRKLGIVLIRAALEYF